MPVSGLSGSQGSELRFTLDVPAGASTTFEFRADRAGTFPYYCNLSDPGSHDMKGELIVRER